MPPKYLTIVNTLRGRIETGTYAHGETALMRDFETSRPTVVRALEILREHGWIETQQGRGRFVRSAQPTAQQLADTRERVVGLQEDMAEVKATLAEILRRLPAAAD